jgi:hypothetical protein
VLAGLLQLDVMDTFDPAPQYESEGRLGGREGWWAYALPPLRKK